MLVLYDTTGRVHAYYRVIILVGVQDTTLADSVRIHETSAYSYHETVQIARESSNLDRMIE